MSSLEDVFEAACSAREIPGVVLLATNRTGSWDYNKAFGHRTALGTDELLEEDCTMWVASCTKLLTSIACMQCVERGLIGLDDDVRVLLHELQHIDIVKRDSAGQGFSSTKNIRPITLRHLLTHTSGFAYEFNEPLLQEWRRQQSAQEKRGSLATLRGRYLHPLLYEPGTSWSYGPSTDWAGLLVERLSGMSLQAYMAHNIWEPLSIKSMTFFLSTRPDMQSRAASMCQRKPDSPMVVIHAERQPTLEPDVEDCLGGGGIYAAPAEYVKVLRALLRDAGISNSTDYEAYDSATTPLPHQQRLLRRSTAESMFEPQLNEPGRKALQAVSEIPRLNLMLGGMPAATKKDWGLGGMLVMEDLSGWRKKGVMTWGGTPNLTWWIDRKTDLCGLYAGQLIPIGDKRSVEMTELFEREMYARYKHHATST